MALKFGYMFLLLAVLVVSICEAAMLFNLIADAHRSEIIELFSPTAGSFLSLEEAFEALRTFEVLGIDTKPDLQDSTCKSVVDTLSSESSNSKDLYHALRVNSLLNCKINKETLTMNQLLVNEMLGSNDEIELLQEDGSLGFNGLKNLEDLYCQASKPLESWVIFEL